MNELPPIEVAPPPVPQPLSLMDRLTGVFVSPGEVFDSLKTSPPAVINWLLPLVLFLLVSWVGAVIVFSNPAVQRQIQEIQEQAIQKQVEAGKITQQQADQIVQMTGKYADIGAKAGAFIGPVFVAFLSVFGWGFAYWLVALMSGQRFRYMKGVEAVGLSNLITVLEAVVHWLLLAAMGTMLTSFSPVLFLKNPDPSGAAYAFFSMLGFIGLWCLGVRAVALSRLGGLSLTLSALWVFGLYLVFCGGLVGLGQLAQMVGGR